MGTVLKFPVKPGITLKKPLTRTTAESVSDHRHACDEVKKAPEKSGIVAWFINFLWVCTLIVWPVLRWIFALDIAYYALMTALAWDDPAKHYGNTLSVHFACFVALMIFITTYKSKNN